MYVRDKVKKCRARERGGGGMAVRGNCRDYGGDNSL